MQIFKNNHYLKSVWRLFCFYSNYLLLFNHVANHHQRHTSSWPRRLAALAMGLVRRLCPPCHAGFHRADGRDVHRAVARVWQIQVEEKSTS